MEQNSIKSEDYCMYLNPLVCKVSSDLEMDPPPGRLNVGMGGGGIPSDPKLVGVGGVSVLPGI